jgi:hypothetical protein
MTIPASAIVRVSPGVISAGGSPLSLNGLILTTSTRTPIGAVVPFSSADSVSAYFGPTSTEAALAAVYFSGFDNATQSPGKLYFAQYVQTTPVAAYVRGTSLAAMALNTLKTVSGSLTVTIDGVAKTAASLNLTAVTSFSAGATAIGTALGLSGGQACTFDSVTQAFVITSGTTGATSTITLATGTAAATLGLSTGAALSQGAGVSSPSAFMTAVTGVTLNWASFMTAFEPDLTNKLLFTTWVQAQNKRFVYVAWDTDATMVTANNTTSFAPVINASNSDGVVVVCGSANYATAQGTTLAALLPPIAAFVMGATASIDFGRKNGRITFAFKSQAGLSSTVADQTEADNIIANGGNFYGAYATANQGFTFLFPGQISGAYDFADEYVNQIYLNSQFQLELVTLLKNIPSIPYNNQGYGLITQALLGPIRDAVNFGSIRIGVSLSSSQVAQVNNSAGVPIDTTLFNTGWYLQIKDPGAQVRGLRGSPQCTFWYMDGGSVQKINLASIVVQ